MLEIHVTADTAEELKAKLAELAAIMGVSLGPVSVETTESGSVHGTATGEPAKPAARRGRKPKDAAAAANALTDDSSGSETEEDEGFNPFEDEEEEEVDLEKLKKDTIARLQKLTETKPGMDTLKALTDKYNTEGVKKFKFQSLDASVFPKIAKDLDTLKA